ncbi:PREDICTED: uncharacterized protein LOC106323044 [Brassica oleracea var. oleracea]|uniref:uncharacterized protein LOC106323044 n=1 Tax=Brassica oleracea var. oleracea TaxID=109376 RepID=UPI0006A706C6|nr:PREDICTED: uncharacterized protein LOC106323044 [Brassica oleracea var. oleracea]
MTAIEGKIKNKFEDLDTRLKVFNRIAFGESFLEIWTFSIIIMKRVERLHKKTKIMRIKARRLTRRMRWKMGMILRMRRCWERARKKLQEEEHEARNKPQKELQDRRSMSLVTSTKKSFRRRSMTLVTNLKRSFRRTSMSLVTSLKRSFRRTSMRLIMSNKRSFRRRSMRLGMKLERIFRRSLRRSFRRRLRTSM